MADAGSGGADHLRQCLLTNFQTDRLQAAFLPEICEQQQRARKPPLARIEKLVDQVFFDPAVPGRKNTHRLVSNALAKDVLNRRALEDAGVEFIPAKSGKGAGVSLCINARES
jgi:hypothetical protein